MNANRNTEPSITLLGGPASFAAPCVLMRFMTEQHPVLVLMLPDRTVFVPEWLQESLRARTIELARRFEKEHRIVIHELLRRARGDIRTSLEPFYGGEVLEAPTLSDSKELQFRVRFRDTELILHVSRALVPCQLHLSNGERYNSEYLFGAYDIVLEYMKTHIDELEVRGFDTSILRLSIQDWEGYRQRLRLV